HGALSSSAFPVQFSPLTDTRSNAGVCVKETDALRPSRKIDRVGQASTHSGWPLWWTPLVQMTTSDDYIQVRGTPCMAIVGEAGACWSCFSTSNSHPTVRTGDLVRPGRAGAAPRERGH